MNKAMHLKAITLTFDDGQMYNTGTVRIERKPPHEDGENRWKVSFDHQFGSEFELNDEAMDEAIHRLSQVRDFTARVREIFEVDK